MRFVFMMPFLVSSLTAQGFSGTVIASFPQHGEASAEYVKLAVKDDRWQVEIRPNEEPQGIAFMFLFDRKTRELREGSFTEYHQHPESAVSLSPVIVPTGPAVALHPLEKREKVADMACSDYSFDAGGESLQGCFTDQLGRFVAPSVQKPLRIQIKKSQIWSPVLPAWALALNENELFPLKVWDARKKVLMQVKYIEAGHLPFCFFEIPAKLPEIIVTHTVTVQQVTIPASSLPAPGTSITPILSLQPPPQCQGPPR